MLIPHSPEKWHTINLFFLVKDRNGERVMTKLIYSGGKGFHGAREQPPTPQQRERSWSAEKPRIRGGSLVPSWQVPAQCHTEQPQILQKREMIPQLTDLTHLPFSSENGYMHRRKIMSEAPAFSRGRRKGKETPTFLEWYQNRNLHLYLQ